MCKGLAKADLSNNIDVISVLFTLQHKEKTLIALWRACNNTDSDKVIDFLRQDSSTQQHQRIAEKSAYALLAKQREYLAVFFFLLAGQPVDAMRVCLKRLHDTQMAFLIKRFHEDLEFDHCPELTPIESFLGAALDSGQSLPWDELLLNPHSNVDWWPPKVAIKKLASVKHPSNYDLADVIDMWERGLFTESQEIIEQIDYAPLRIQLLYEMSSLSRVRPG